MKSSFLFALFVLSFIVRAQAPATAPPVPLSAEPHHHLILENPYVRVWFFDIAGHEATLLHAHDLPYLAIALLPGDYVNAVAGKPEAHVTLDDGQINYSKGGFAHVVRTDEGSPFHNFTVELLRPQGTARNRCTKVIDGPYNCPVEAAGKPAVELPAFETDGVLVQAGALPEGRFYNAGATQSPRLFLVLSDSHLSVEVPGTKAKKLQGGEVYWLPAGSGATFTDITPPKKGKDKDRQDDIKFSRFYILTFKETGAAQSVPPLSALTPGGCSVTQPNGYTPPGQNQSPSWHGSPALWTALSPNGVIEFRSGGPGFVQPDGSMSMKQPWWRGVRGQLTIQGRRLDAPAPPLRAAIPDGYGDTGFQATALIFPTEGCWEVTGTVAQSSLTFVTRVIRVTTSK